MIKHTLINGGDNILNIFQKSLNALHYNLNDKHTSKYTNNTKQVKVYIKTNNSLQKKHIYPQGKFTDGLVKTFSVKIQKITSK